MKKLGLGLLVILSSFGILTSCEDSSSELFENTPEEVPSTGGEDENEPVNSGGGSGGNG